jgi:hypothetical protein
MGRMAYALHSLIGPLGLMGLEEKERRPRLRFPAMHRLLLPGPGRTSLAMLV